MRRECRGAFVERWVRVGEEDQGMERVVLAGGEEVQREDGRGEEERDEPGVFEA